MYPLIQDVDKQNFSNLIVFFEHLMQSELVNPEQPSHSRGQSLQLYPIYN